MRRDGSASLLDVCCELIVVVRVVLSNYSGSKDCCSSTISVVYCPRPYEMDESASLAFPIMVM